MITQEKIAYSADEIKAMVKTCEKYNKALERAREQYNKRTPLYDIEYIFPELKESEEERIRKAIKKALQVRCDGSRIISDEPVTLEEALAWVEKQGEEEYALKSFRDKDVHKFMQYIEKQAKAYEFNLPNRSYDIYAFAKDILYWLEKQGKQNPVEWSEEDEKIKESIKKVLANTNFNKLDIKYSFYEMISWLDKQGENKPTDNVEPKFKVGNWITDGYIYYKITEILDDRYIIESKYDKRDAILFEYENRYHLWTIEDAKDGDVLYSIDSKQSFIYKERPQFSQARGYCCINKFGEFAIWNTSKCVICTDKYIPATKEQRDLLFEKMTEAGYEWDAEKKELKKIEPKFKVGDFIINDYCLGKVIEITNDAYLLDTGQGIPFSCKNTHLWAIEDAKDGDVLDCEGCEYLLFKSFSNTDGRIKLYCWYNVQTNSFHGRGTDSKLRQEANIHPATKEQRDLLFSKMKEAGYEWDSEKKELKKIEPKFKVGNWYQCTKDFFGKGVTFDKNTAYYCAKEGCLQNEYGCHIAIVKDLYDNFKLWTIEDAKDGDVLVYVTDEEDLWIMIYWSLYEPYEGHVHYHALLVNDNFSDKGTCCICIDNLKPATKEQRDWLFSKMKEVGYEWDADKKELKKIEVASKESKDERMMEQLCDFLRDNMLYQDAQEITSWLEKLLEKQGEQMATSKSK